jgi:NADH-quinone oxidoreductase subunit A
MDAIGDYGYVLLFFAGALGFGVITLFMSRLLGPHRPGKEKNSTYECGEVPIGVAWIQFNVSYYIFALIFVIFDVETVFLFPWAVVLKTLKKMGYGPFTVFEMSVFIGILFLGLIYAWKKGVLSWQ